MEARIYQPPKSPTQSGHGNTKQWVLEFEPEEKKQIEPLMGWIGSGDMRGQVQLRFPTRDEAVAYAERRGIPYVVSEPKHRRIKPKSYADNFRYDRVE